MFSLPLYHLKGLVYIDVSVTTKSTRSWDAAFSAHDKGKSENDIPEKNKNPSHCIQSWIQRIRIDPSTTYVEIDCIEWAKAKPRLMRILAYRAQLSCRMNCSSSRTS